jgi:integrase
MSSARLIVSRATWKWAAISGCEGSRSPGANRPVRIAARLGHADASMTLRVYAHLWPDDEDRSRQAVDDALKI